jgi:predicted DNA-binding ribbon-helix-helix protein
MPDTWYEKRPRGRPRLPDGTARTRRVVSLFTEAEFAELERLAGESQLTVSALIHAITSKHLEKEP